MSKITKVSAVVCFLLLLNISNVFSQGVRITYQGSLSENGSRPTGDFDLTFSLFDQLTGGVQHGTTVTNLSVEVADGLFTTPMDLVIFDVIAARWLEVGVRPAGESGDFTTLAPRQELTETPFALTSVFAESANTLNAETSDQINAYADGKKVFQYRTFADIDASTLPVNSNGFSNLVNVIQGSRANEVLNGARGATIGGGGADEYSRSVEFGLQYLDRANKVGADFATVGGGAGNSALPYAATVAGGFQNNIFASSDYSTISGGGFHYIRENSRFATITGGENNHIETDANYATIVGGRFNTADASQTFAAGTRSQANHQGAFVWSDSSFTVFPSVREDEFAVGADNGVRIKAGATKNALEIESGGIKVTGAGVGTATPAFIHKATAENISGHITTIDNVHCNGQPEAILLVTHNWSKDTAGNRYETEPFGVYYTSGRWQIFHEAGGAAPMPAGRAFNVLVIKP